MPLSRSVPVRPDAQIYNLVDADGLLGTQADDAEELSAQEFVRELRDNAFSRNAEAHDA